MNKLKVKYKIIISIIVTVMLVVLISIIYKDYRIRHAKVLIALRTNLNIEVYDQVKLKDLIISINGKLLKNPSINTSKLGKPLILSVVNLLDILSNLSFILDSPFSSRLLIFSLLKYFIKYLVLFCIGSI